MNKDNNIEVSVKVPFGSWGDGLGQEVRMYLRLDWPHISLPNGGDIIDIGDMITDITQSEKEYHESIGFYLEVDHLEFCKTGVTIKAHPLK